MSPWKPFSLPTANWGEPGRLRPRAGNLHRDFTCLCFRDADEGVDQFSGGDVNDNAEHRTTEGAPRRPNRRRGHRAD